ALEEEGASHDSGRPRRGTGAGVRGDRRIRARVRILQKVRTLGGAVAAPQLPTGLGQIVEEVDDPIQRREQIRARAVEADRPRKARRIRRDAWSRKDVLYKARSSLGTVARPELVAMLLVARDEEEPSVDVRQGRRKGGASKGKG